MHDDSFKLGTCPRCKQENRVLMFFTARVKGTNNIVSGYVCFNCLNEIKREEREQYAEIRQGNS